MMTNLIAAMVLALGEIESGNNDMAVSKAGAIGRTQIMPTMWRAYTTRPLSDARKVWISTRITAEILADNHAFLLEILGADPKPREHYLLWVKGIGKFKVKSRLKLLKAAERFENLTNDYLAKGMK